MILSDGSGSNLKAVLYVKPASSKGTESSLQGLYDHILDCTYLIDDFIQRNIFRV